MPSEPNETHEQADKRPQSLIDTKPDQRVTLLEGSVSTNKAEVRRSPQIGAVIGELSTGRHLTFIARTPDSSWLRIDTRNGAVAWIQARHVTVNGDISTLYVMANV